MTGKVNLRLPAVIGDGAISAPATHSAFAWPQYIAFVEIYHQIGSLRAQGRVNGLLAIARSRKRRSNLSSHKSRRAALATSRRH